MDPMEWHVDGQKAPLNQLPFFPFANQLSSLSMSWFSEDSTVGRLFKWIYVIYYMIHIMTWYEITLVKQISPASIFCTPSGFTVATVACQPTVGKKKK